MPTPDSQDAYLHRLAGWRSRRTNVGDLSFIEGQFQRQYARPHAQLGQLVALWEDTVPVAIAQRTTLRRFARATLHVAVPDSATHYQLDRALRSGLLAALRQGFKGNLRVVKIEVGA